MASESKFYGTHSSQCILTTVTTVHSGFLTSPGFFLCTKDIGALLKLQERVQCVIEQRVVDATD
jgi:hypothetical protein